MSGASRQAIGVDVGGTKIAGVRADSSGAVLDRARRVTPDTDDALLEVIVAIVGELRRGTDDVPVGLAVAAMVDQDAGVLRSAPNLPWHDTPLRRMAHAALSTRVALDNDCTAATYAEWQVGAAVGHDDVLYVGVGTGVGGGIVSGGRLRRGARGFAGEIGHVIVEPDGPLCGCGNRGCWETVASGGAIERAGMRAVSRHTHSLLAESAGGVPERVDGPMVTEAARAGDPAATGILAEVGNRLGQGIAGLVNVLDPAIVVVGGGAADAGDLLLVPARAAYLRTVESRGERPAVPIVPAALGADSAAIGGALLALDEDAWP